MKRGKKTARQKAWDIAFDELRAYVFARDGKCVLCGLCIGAIIDFKKVVFQCSHFFSRGKKSTALDPRNAYCQCKGCHMKFHKVNSKPYNDFIRARLGQEELDKMELLSNTIAKYTVDDILAIAEDLKQRRLELGRE